MGFYPVVPVDPREQETVLTPVSCAAYWREETLKSAQKIATAASLIPQLLDDEEISAPVRYGIYMKTLDRFLRNTQM